MTVTSGLFAGELISWSCWNHDKRPALRQIMDCDHTRIGTEKRCASRIFHSSETGEQGGGPHISRSWDVRDIECISIFVSIVQIDLLVFNNNHFLPRTWSCDYAAQWVISKKFCRPVSNLEAPGPPGLGWAGLGWKRLEIDSVLALSQPLPMSRLVRLLGLLKPKIFIEFSTSSAPGKHPRTQFLRHIIQVLFERIQAKSLDCTMVSGVIFLNTYYRN